MPATARADAPRPSLTLTRHFKATPHQVYRAWTEPDGLIRWFGPDHTVPGSFQTQMDVREGGRFRIRFSTADGEAHEVGGVYREVVANERLVFTWAWHTTPDRESLVTVSLRPDGSGTLLTLHHAQFFNEAARDGHNRGWTATLDKLGHWLETAR